MLSSNMLVPILIPLIDVTFSTPTPGFNSYYLQDSSTVAFDCQTEKDVSRQRAGSPDLGRLKLWQLGLDLQPCCSSSRFFPLGCSFHRKPLRKNRLRAVRLSRRLQKATPDCPERTVTSPRAFRRSCIFQIFPNLSTCRMS